MKGNWKETLAKIAAGGLFASVACFVSISIGYMFGSEDMRNTYRNALNEAAEEEDGWNIQNIERKVDRKDPWHH
ncbi:MAG: hypothetical protein IKU36_01825 [Bacteroidales bacterium]|nr:hypothetical protein [Bacteroidales bacterium]